MKTIHQVLIVVIVVVLVLVVAGVALMGNKGNNNDNKNDTTPTTNADGLYNYELSAVTSFKYDVFGDQYTMTAPQGQKYVVAHVYVKKITTDELIQITYGYGFFVLVPGDTQYTYTADTLDYPLSHNVAKPLAPGSGGDNYVLFIVPLNSNLSDFSIVWNGGGNVKFDSTLKY